MIRRSYRFLTFAAICATLGVLSPARAAAQSSVAGVVPASVQDSKSEDARRHSEEFSGITVITAEEIQACGYHTLAEALRWVRGLYVVDDHTYGYVGIRGIQRPGDYNNKVLLRIDGHAMAGSVYGDTYLGSELGLDLERVDRIEVVRGQGSALNGANAVLAVVNVITRQPARDQGIDVAGWTGGPAERRGALSLGAGGPGSSTYALSASWLDENGLGLGGSAFEEARLSDVRIAGRKAFSLLGRGEWRGLRVRAKFNQRTKPNSEDGVNRAYDGHDFVDLSRSQRLSPELELEGRGWWDGSRYRVYSTDTAGLTNAEFGTGDVIGTEWRLRWSTSERSVLTTGVEGQYSARARLITFVEPPYAVNAEKNLDRGLAAFYVQDQRLVAAHLRVTTGARLDAFAGFDPIVSPRLDVEWDGPSGWIARVFAGSANRVPTVYETCDRESQSGAAPLDPERTVTLEGAIERAAGPYRASLTGYVNELRGLIEVAELDASGTAGYTNAGTANARGIEGELRMTGRAGNQVRIALAWQKTQTRGTGVDLSNSPRWNAHVLATHAAPSSRFTAGAGARWLSQREKGDGTHVGDAIVADARLGVRLQPFTVLGLEVKNLFDERYSDPASISPVREMVPQEPRAIYLTLRHQGAWPR